MRDLYADVVAIVLKGELLGGIEGVGRHLRGFAEDDEPELGRDARCIGAACLASVKVFAGAPKKAARWSPVHVERGCESPIRGSRTRKHYSGNAPLRTTRPALGKAVEETP